MPITIALTANNTILEEKYDYIFLDFGNRSADDLKDIFNYIKDQTKTRPVAIGASDIRNDHTKFLSELCQ